MGSPKVKVLRICEGLLGVDWVLALCKCGGFIEKKGDIDQAVKELAFHHMYKNQVNKH